MEQREYNISKFNFKVYTFYLKKSIFFNYFKVDTVIVYTLIYIIHFKIIYLSAFTTVFDVIDTKNMQKLLTLVWTPSINFVSATGVITTVELGPSHWATPNLFGPTFKSKGPPLLFFSFDNGLIKFK